MLHNRARSSRPRVLELCFGADVTGAKASYGCASSIKPLCSFNKHEGYGYVGSRSKHVALVWTDFYGQLRYSSQSIVAAEDHAYDGKIISPLRLGKLQCYAFE